MRPYSVAPVMNGVKAATGLPRSAARCAIVFERAQIGDAALGALVARQLLGS